MFSLNLGVQPLLQVRGFYFDGSHQYCNIEYSIFTHRCCRRNSAPAPDNCEGNITLAALIVHRFRYGDFTPEYFPSCGNVPVGHTDKPTECYQMQYNLFQLREGMFDHKYSWRNLAPKGLRARQKFLLGGSKFSIGLI